MPPTRITVAMNANQSQKAPLLIPMSISSPEAIRDLVFKTAKSKFRLKKPARIFVAGTGEELVVGSEEQWRHIHDDVTLLVSSGEEFVGVKKEGRHAEANPDCPVHILAEKAPVDQLSITQLHTTAHTLPGIVHAVGQPDLHPGTKFPIGAVFVSRKWIHPPLIGSDIGCGMAWYKTQLSRSQVDGDKGKKIAEKLRGLEGPWRTQGDREQWLRDVAGSCSAGEQWDKSIGTIGAGNHFAEIQVVESLSLSSSTCAGLQQDDVVLLVHSGSRGYGGSILKKYTAESHVSLREGSAEMRQYMEEHDRACRWAKANRNLIALRFLSCLEPGEQAWELGQNNAAAANVTSRPDRISHAKVKLSERQVVDIWHNNVERVNWPPRPTCASPSRPLTEASCVSDEVEEPFFIHRKGAAPTSDPATGLLLAVIPLPGSRATPTMMLKPKLSQDNDWGLTNASSLAHGAGRSMSRAKALKSLGEKYRNQNLLEPRSGEGTWVICDEKDLVFEEAPEAYKDVVAVSQDLVHSGVAEEVGICKARVSYKVRNEAK